MKLYATAWHLDAWHCKQTQPDVCVCVCVCVSEWCHWASTVTVLHYTHYSLLIRLTLKYVDQFSSNWPRGISQTTHTHTPAVGCINTALVHWTLCHAAGLQRLTTDWLSVQPVYALVSHSHTQQLVECVTSSLYFVDKCLKWTVNTRGDCDCGLTDWVSERGVERRHFGAFGAIHGVSVRNHG